MRSSSCSSSSTATFRTDDVHHGLENHSATIPGLFVVRNVFGSATTSGRKRKNIVESNTPSSSGSRAPENKQEELEQAGVGTKTAASSCNSTALNAALRECRKLLLETENSDASLWRDSEANQCADVLENRHDIFVRDHCDKKETTSLVSSRTSATEAPDCTASTDNYMKTSCKNEKNQQYMHFGTLPPWVTHGLIENGLIRKIEEFTNATFSSEATPWEELLTEFFDGEEKVERFNSMIVNQYHPTKAQIQHLGGGAGEPSEDGCHHLASSSSSASFSRQDLNHTGLLRSTTCGRGQVLVEQLCENAGTRSTRRGGAGREEEDRYAIRPHVDLLKFGPCVVGFNILDDEVNGSVLRFHEILPRRLESAAAVASGISSSCTSDGCCTSADPTVVCDEKENYASSSNSHAATGEENNGPPLLQSCQVLPGEEQNLVEQGRIGSILLDVFLKPGDCYILTREARYACAHSILPVMGERISVTVRACS
ncbi:unnamed protein product [Amoebophrya sp. A120]|nr:unnamed protein product [Amoebophrya sp. A120]|eukprot:GSA120T00019602001.1